MASAGPTPDVAVIGGGIIGTATAAFLSEGGLRVRLYEATAIAAGASGRNSGIVQHPFDPVMASLYRDSLAEYRHLAAVSDDTFRLGDDPAGLLYVGHDPVAAERTAGLWAAAWPDTRPELLDGLALTRLEPSLAPDVVACRLAIGFPVEPAAATVAFAARARRLGVEIVAGIAGRARPRIVADRVVGIELGGSVEPAGAVVVAAGPWTPEVIDQGGGWRPIRPSWGVVAAVALPDPPRHGLEGIDIAIEPTDEDASPGSDAAGDGEVEFSLVPADGASSLGSTFLPAEPEPAAWLDALRRVGSRYVPAVADAPVLGLRCCARPVSQDGRPLVGAASWLDGLWIAAGHGPWGISTGPGSARLLADAILDPATTGSLPIALAVDRFGSPRAGSQPGR